MGSRDMVLRKLGEIGTELEGLGVSNLWLFGSCARDEATPADADFLVEFNARPTLTNFMELKFLLEETLGMPVDLHTHSSCPDRFMDRIQPELLHVAQPSLQA